MGNPKNGKNELVWLSEDIVNLSETVSKKMGLSKSGFYRYCVLKQLESLSLLSNEIKKELKV